jgi:hypothetical protein
LRLTLQPGRVLFPLVGARKQKHGSCGGLDFS